MGAAPARRAGLEKNASASINLNWILLLVLRVEPLSPGRPGMPAPRNLARVARVHAGDGLRDHAFLELLLDGSAELCALGVLAAVPQLGRLPDRPSGLPEPLVDLLSGTLRAEEPVRGSRAAGLFSRVFFFPWVLLATALKVLIVLSMSLPPTKCPPSAASTSSKSASISSVVASRVTCVTPSPRRRRPSAGRVV